MSLEKDRANAELAPLDIDGFVNPPRLVCGDYNFKCAIDSDGNVWTTEHCADGDLLGWNDLLCYEGKHKEFAVTMILQHFGLDIRPHVKILTGGKSLE